MANELSNSVYVNSDYRKKFRYGAETFFGWGKEQAYKVDEYSFYLTYQPLDALTISLNPAFSKNHNKLQYVDNLDTPDGIRYLNAEINQETLRMSLRVNYNINPNLTIQYWGQPFISRGRYSNFKYITDPIADTFNNRFFQYNDTQLVFNEEDEEYLIDETQTE